MSNSRRLTIGQNIDSGESGGGSISTSNYMTILALEDGLTASLSANACQYCVDGDGNWVDLPSGTTTQAINQGQTLSFRGNLTPSSSSGIGTFTINKNCNLEGNCMSLLFGDDAMNNNSLSGKTYAFRYLFSGCTTIIQVSKSFLPSLSVSDWCYRSMFQGCSSLTTAPELPATTLARSCYDDMFRGCGKLTSAPELPATTLADSCYSNMFSGCSGLTSAPELPATTLANHCYSSMFYKCTSLKATPRLPATILASSCYENMFGDCTSLTTAPPILPATTLASDCYRSMFYGCSKLTSVNFTLPATTLAGNCYSAMFYRCYSLTVAPELPATTLADSCYRSMFWACVELTVAPELPATTLADSCYSEMFDGCYSLTVAPELPATTLASTCYDGMFYGCTNLTTAPELPATTLAEYCYRDMFNRCRNLNYIKMLATDISATSCLSSWVGGVSSTGTFVKNPAMTSLPTGDSGIPSGWTVVDDGEESGGNLITFTVNGVEYQAEEGMTFYDWGMSEYYDSSINLSTDLDKTFRESCELHGNTPTYCYNNAGLRYTPDIKLNSVIQPISYILNIGDY